MIRNPIRKALLAVALFVNASAFATTPGAPAPDFKGTDANGTTQTLSQYRGKYVVLEWANQGCPFDRKHYLSGSMEALQKQWTGKGVVWLSIISSAPGEQGYVTPAEERDYLQKMHAVPTAAILDPTGTIGRLYSAKTTPHMFVIDPSGRIIYQGAIDDKPTPDQADLKGAHNYVTAALESAMAGKPVEPASTRPYGCSVKYAD
jgi:hypothetical protein